LETDQGCGQRHLHDAHLAERLRDSGQGRALVLPLRVALQVDAPDLGGAGPIPERSERDRGFHRPAALEPARPEIPDRIPVDVHLALVGDLGVEAAARGVDGEDDGVAAVMERVEDDVDVVVLAPCVSPHVVGGDPVGVLPAAERHEDRGFVERDPDIRPVGGRLSRPRFDLKEVRNRRHGVVEGLVEPAVDAERRGEADRSHRGLARVVPVHHGRRHGRRRTVEGEGKVQRLRQRRRGAGRRAGFLARLHGLSRKEAGGEQADRQVRARHAARD